MAGALSTAQGRIRWTRRALALVLVGLVVQLICVAKLTPATFLILAVFGVGPVAVAVLIFARVVWVAGRRDEPDPESAEAEAMARRASAGEASEPAVEVLDEAPAKEGD